MGYKCFMCCSIDAIFFLFECVPLLKGKKKNRDGKLVYLASLSCDCYDDCQLFPIFLSIVASFVGTNLVFSNPFSPGIDNKVVV